MGASTCRQSWPSNSARTRACEGQRTPVRRPLSLCTPVRSSVFTRKKRDDSKVNLRLTHHLVPDGHYEIVVHVIICVITLLEMLIIFRNVLKDSTVSGVRAHLSRVQFWAGSRVQTTNWSVHLLRSEHAPAFASMPYRSSGSAK